MREDACHQSSTHCVFPWSVGGLGLQSLEGPGSAAAGTAARPSEPPCFLLLRRCPGDGIPQGECNLGAEVWEKALSEHKVLRAPGWDPLTAD